MINNSPALGIVAAAYAVSNKVRNGAIAKPRIARPAARQGTPEPTGRGAIVVPTGFITAKSGVEKKILERIVNDHIIFGVVSMPSNVFATTGTNVSVLFFDRSEKKDDDKVILIDASKLGEEYKEGNNQKRRLRPEEIEKIVQTFRNKETVEDFSVAVTYDAIKEKGYSLSAGQYFDIKIDYVDITADEFNNKMTAHKKNLKRCLKKAKNWKMRFWGTLKS